MAEIFTYKLVPETNILSFEFTQVLVSGETITNAASSILVMDGVDPSPSSVLAGTPTISGTKVYQRVQGGVAGVTYRLAMTIQTSLANTYVGLGDLPVYSLEEVQ